MKPTEEEMRCTNLCENCIYSIAECRPVEILFGTGIGEDNIVRCDVYKGENDEKSNIL